MGRLLRRTLENEPYCPVPCGDYSDDCYDCGYFWKILDKLARYEDLEAAGRLVVLPEGFNFEWLKTEHCPGNLGFPQEECKEYKNCDECWEAALRGRDYIKEIDNVKD